MGGTQVMMAATNPPLQRWRVLGRNTEYSEHFVNEGVNKATGLILLIYCKYVKIALGNLQESVKGNQKGAQLTIGYAEFEC